MIRIISLAVLFVATAAWSQTTGAAVLSDEIGFTWAAVPSAKVIVQNQETPSAIRGLPRANGEYSIPTFEFRNVSAPLRHKASKRPCSATSFSESMKLRVSTSCSRSAASPNR